MIIAFHGFLGSKEDFNLFQKYFPRKLEAKDLVGHGSWREAVYDLDFHCSSQVEYWRENIPEKSILLGYSMGGRLALQLVSRYPEHFSALILIGASAGLEEEEERKVRRGWDQAVANRFSKGMRAFLEYWNSLPIIQSQQNIEPEYYREMQARRLRQAPNLMAKSMQIFGTGTMPSCQHLLEGIEIPVLLLAGEKDRKYVEIGKDLEEKLPNALFQIIPNAGHCSHLEQPQKTAEIIEEWLLQAL